MAHSFDRFMINSGNYCSTVVHFSFIYSTDVSSNELPNASAMNRALSVAIDSTKAPYAQLAATCLDSPSWKVCWWLFMYVTHSFILGHRHCRSSCIHADLSNTWTDYGCMWTIDVCIVLDG